MYNKIYNFCKVKNLGGIYKNGTSPTPRVKFIMDLLKSEKISFGIDQFSIEDEFNWFKRSRRNNQKNYGFNVVMKGSSSKMVVAHHDIVNINSDNANDNSASVINAIMLKKLIPELTVVLLDGEEVGGLGSDNLAKEIDNGDFGNIDWVLNLELTGIGGEKFFIGNYPGNLYDHINDLFDCPTFSTPFNDSVIFRQYGIDSCVINPLPVTNEKTPIKWDDDTYLDYKILFNCHSMQDSVQKISTNDMKDFVEKVLVKIVS